MDGDLLHIRDKLTTIEVPKSYCTQRIEDSHKSTSGTREAGKLLTCKPQASWFQWRADWPRGMEPREALLSTFHHVHTCIVATIVPETTRIFLCTVHIIQIIIVSVIGREHHPIVVAHSVACVAGIAGHCKRVVVDFWSDEKSVIIGHVDVAIRSGLDETPQFVASFFGQLVQQIVAEPVVASRVVESDFKLRPRTVEEVGPVNILLNQKWNAVSCQSNEHQQLIAESHCLISSCKQEHGTDQEGQFIWPASMGQLRTGRYMLRRAAWARPVKRASFPKKMGNFDAP